MQSCRAGGRSTGVSSLLEPASLPSALPPGCSFSQTRCISRAPSDAVTVSGDIGQVDGGEVAPSPAAPRGSSRTPLTGLRWKCFVNPCNSRLH